MNTVIQKQVSAVTENCHGVFAACDKGIQVISRIIGKRKDTTLHIQNDQTAVFRQFKRIFYPVTVVNIAFVRFKPGLRGKFLFLIVPDGDDVVADASDNYPTRYLVNDTCVLLGKPDVFGAMYQFEGQVSVYYA